MPHKIFNTSPPRWNLAWSTNVWFVLSAGYWVLGQESHRSCWS